jgi:hypothetical protein
VRKLNKIHHPKAVLKTIVSLKVEVDEKDKSITRTVRALFATKWHQTTEYTGKTTLCTIQTESRP